MALVSCTWFSICGCACTDRSNQAETENETTSKLAPRWPAYSPEAYREANEKGQFVLIHAYATWMTTSVVDYYYFRSDPNILEYLHDQQDKLSTLALDCTELPESRAAVDSLGIDRIPHTLLFAPDGTKIWSSNVAADPEHLLAELKRHMEQNR